MHRARRRRQLGVGAVGMSSARPRDDERSTFRDRRQHGSVTALGHRTIGPPSQRPQAGVLSLRAERRWIEVGGSHGVEKATARIAMAEVTGGVREPPYPCEPPPLSPAPTSGGREFGTTKRFCNRSFCTLPPLRGAGLGVGAREPPGDAHHSFRHEPDRWLGSRRNAVKSYSLAPSPSWERGLGVRSPGTDTASSTQPTRPPLQRAA